MPESAQSTDDILVRVRDLHFARGSRKIFDGVDLDIRRGKVTVIMGPSGTGKTTLLRLIGGQLSPHTGQIWVDGEEVPKLTTISCTACVNAWACCSRAARCSPI